MRSIRTRQLTLRALTAVIGRSIRRRARRAHRLGQPREFAQQRARLARIDDLLDPELFGRAERRAQLVEAVLDLLQFGLGIVGGVDVGAIGRLDAAFQRQRTPIGRRPGIAHREPVRRLMHDAGDAERIAHDDGAPGHGGLVDRGHRAHAVADGRRLLGLEPDHEARAIHQIDHRQMEGLGEIDPAHHLLAGIRGPRSAVMEGVAGEQQHRAAFQPRKAHDDRAAEIGVHLEERTLVDDGVDDRPHLVDLAAVARHRLHQRFLRALRIVVARHGRRQFIDRRRQIGQEAPGAFERLFLGIDGIDRRRRRGSGCRRRQAPAW